MKVLFATSEATPFSSTGGLGEVSHSLPCALKDLGVDIVRVMPMYRGVMEGGHDLTDTGLRLRIPAGFRVFTADVWKSAPEDAPPTYFIRRDEYFDRRELYTLPERDYTDNLERFSFFQKAVVALMDQLPFAPDIVHANDWTTGLLAMYLRHGISGTGRAAREKTIFTIHNLAYQGVFQGAEFSITNLPFSCFSIQGMEFYGNINCMKAGLTSATRVTTVSRSYAREICTKEHGCGLEGVLQQLGDRLTGIPNGVDYRVWNPISDPLIDAGYSPENLDGKRECRKSLLEFCEWPVETNAPIVGIVTRLVPQKGVDLMDEAMPRLIEKGLRFVLLGSGQDAEEALCREWARRWPGQVYLRIGYDRALAHQIQAGADFFLMPSRVEPGGLSQLYAMKYGTIPIVHATGGLRDTVTDLAGDPENGNGFVFDEYTAESLIESVSNAMALWKDKDRKQSILQRIMREDHDWTRSARCYIKLYEEALSS